MRSQPNSASAKPAGTASPRSALQRIAVPYASTQCPACQGSADHGRVETASIRARGARVRHESDRRVESRSEEVERIADAEDVVRRIRVRRVGGSLRSRAVERADETGGGILPLLQAGDLLPGGQLRGRAAEQQIGDLDGIALCADRRLCAGPVAEEPHLRHPRSIQDRTGLRSERGPRSRRAGWRGSARRAPPCRGVAPSTG